MTKTAQIALLCQAVVIALAWALSRRRPEHRPFALFASAMLAADLTGWATIAACPWISSPGPFEGARRLIFHADQALFVFSWQVSLAACCWAVFLRRWPLAPLLAGVLVEVVLVLGYPGTFRGVVLGRAYAVIHGAALLACSAAVLFWARRREPMRPEHGAALFVVLLDLAYFVGPYALPEPWLAWADSGTIALVIWGGLLLIHAGALWDDFLLAPLPKRPRLD